MIGKFCLTFLINNSAGDVRHKILVKDRMNNNEILKFNLS